MHEPGIREEEIIRTRALDGPAMGVLSKEWEAVVPKGTPEECKICGRRLEVDGTREKDVEKGLDLRAEAGCMAEDFAPLEHRNGGLFGANRFPATGRRS